MVVNPDSPDPDLSEASKGRLREALAELRQAVAAYDLFVVDGPLQPRDPESEDSRAMLEAQRRVQSAEQHYWGLRRELFGEGRPSLPPAWQMADWFSEEDEAFDKDWERSR